MGERIGFVVVTYSPRGRPHVGFLLASEDEATAWRDESARVSRTAGRDERHVLAEVFELEEGAGDGTA